MSAKLLSILVLTAALVGVCQAVAFASPALDDRAEWYEPQETDFKPIYERDKANMTKQSWKDYWGWVKSFYSGNLLDSGWTKRGADLLVNIRKEETKLELRAKLNALGRSIAAEWSKANEGRKVDTSKLIAWGLRMKEAKSKDAGDGAHLKKEIESIAKELDSAAK
jgi:hypothetical protein